MFFLALFLKRPDQRREKSIPGPWNLPFIGSLHHLLRSRLPHQTLRHLSSIHGPVMRLKLGQIHAIVISSAAAAKEIMKTHDTLFLSRPVSDSVKALSYGGKDIAFAPHGDYWRKMRQLCLSEILSAKRVRSFRSVREEEISNLVRFIAASAEEKAVVNLSERLLQLSSDIAARAVVGRKIANQKLLQSLIADVAVLISGFNAADLFPSTPFIGRITGFQCRVEQCRLRIDYLSEEIVRVHRRKRDDELFAEEDITDVLLRIQEDGSLQFPFTNDHIKAVINDLLVAGTETTATTMEWAMAELMQNPNVMRKLQKEVRDAFGCAIPTTVAEEEAMMRSGNFTYLHLVIKETLRLHPPLPLLLPRENRESFHVMGYDIPAKMVVMVNAWAIGRDPSYWDEPHLFRPERFLDGGVDFKGGHLEFIPFGAGRRMCPGMRFGLAVAEMALAHLVYYFDWEFVGKKGEKLDMTEAFGASAKKKFPLVLLPLRHTNSLSEDYLSKI